MNTLFISTLLWMTLTIFFYQVSVRLFQFSKRFVLFHPVLLTITALILLLLHFEVPYTKYFENVKILHLLLGPSTVALAVPLYEQRKKLKQLLFPLLITLFFGSIIAIISSIFVAKFLGASFYTMKSVAAKSVTTPIAIAITEKIQGDTSLCSVIVILTGLFGAVVGMNFLKFLPFEDDEAKGFAMGMACHGIGTARAFEENKYMGAFAGLAIGLNGMITAILLPIIFKLLDFN